ncbi:MAG: FAD-dependent oxidoreductase [Anaerolineaceae bacterium]|nr:FAD-dependent oxidoreductase [Anaerolineaceae bacterium]
MRNLRAYKYIIVGGGLAGGSAAGAIRQVDTAGPLILVTQEPWKPYQRPPLSKTYLQGKAGRDKVFFRDPEFYRENEIQIPTGVRATSLEPDEHVVSLDDGRLLSYEKLLLATGGYPWRPPIPGNDLARVFTLRTIEDSEAIRAAAGPGKRALVLGGSFIGSEVAASLAELGTEVTVAFQESRILELLAPPELSEAIHALYDKHGVRLVPGTAVQSLEGDRAVRTAQLDGGESLQVDLVVMGTGIRLNTGLAREAGLEMAGDDSVVVDERLCTSDPDIYAAGDIASWPDPTFGRLRVEHWDVAKNQGQRAGRNMAGEEEPYTTLPYFFSDIFDFSFEVWGNLSSWKRTVQRGDLNEGSFAFYYFDDKGRLTGVLAADRPDEERKPMQTLVRQRPAYDQVAEGLRSEGTDLRDLI